MNKFSKANIGITLAGVVAFFGGTVKADTFGSGANVFTIDFVNVGNAGNADDFGDGGGLYSSPYGGVAYDYRMGTYEISENLITKATASGMTNVTGGAWGASQPTALMTWYEAAAFVNWLNTSTGHQAAYNIDAGVTALTLWSSGDAWQAGGENLYRHKDAYYFLPSEDEWYKAAFHKNDGVTANYWDYATGSNTAPTSVVSGTSAGTAVYSTLTPANVDAAGGLSPYGTMGQNGNVFEWLESAFDGSNDSPSESRTGRGGDWNNSVGSLRPYIRLGGAPYNSTGDITVRVASIIPEPSPVMLMVGFGLILLLRRRRICLI